MVLLQWGRDMSVGVEAAIWPTWLPDGVRLYLNYIRGERTLRDIALSEGCHASTILRKVRALEHRRDDPLIDEALWSFEELPPLEVNRVSIATQKDDIRMSAPIRLASKVAPCEAVIAREARRILRRLSESGAVLAVANDMDKAAVMKGEVRIGVVDRNIAQAFALKDWIAAKSTGRVGVYLITAAGRAALKRLLADEKPSDSEDGDTAPFANQHRTWGERSISDKTGPSGRMRYNLSESPLTALGRRTDKDGKPFLDRSLIAAGERLREDFEMAQMGPRVAQNWDRFLAASDRSSVQSGGGESGRSSLARARIAAALRDLGPGLGDVALRCCCFLEGLEVTEKRMGWSARSGKIVLRIALIRLKRHYDEVYQGKSPLIG